MRYVYLVCALFFSSVVFGQQNHVAQTPAGSVAEAVSTYPNPVSSTLFVSIDFDLFEAKHWQLHDLLGNLVDEGSVLKGEKTVKIDMTERQSDIYLLRLYGPKGQLITRRIMKR